MSRYYRDARGTLHCAHGIILFGDSCTRCEREEGPPTSPYSARDRARSIWQETASRNPVEVITDPFDPRGYSARQVGPVRQEGL